MQLSDFDFDLPRELIAQHPAPSRAAARLLVPEPGSAVNHATVAELPALLRAGDLVVLNDTRVRRARLFARRASGGRVELFVLGREESTARPWRVMVNPARKLKPGERLTLLAPSELANPDAAVWHAVAIERLPQDPSDPDSKPGPCWHVRFERSEGAASDDELEALFERFGHIPLPPYIVRDNDHANQAEDAERYQTVFATKPGAVAAPTAGLHLTEALLAELVDRGIELAHVTLHVGLGTFLPVETERIEDHVMHSEAYELQAPAAARINACRERGGRVVAIGTTSVRVLETAADERGIVHPGRGTTNIFITPGYRFRVVDVLLTNFHLPGSTLLMLVSAFIGREAALELYRLAVAERYRFFSYGDAMLLTRRS